VNQLIGVPFSSDVTTPLVTESRHAAIRRDALGFTSPDTFPTRRT
jgi:hypothetical protein